MIIIKINELINSDEAVTPNQGRIVFDFLKEKINLNTIEHNEKIIFDFENINELTTAFLHLCLGMAFKVYPTKYILNNFKFENLRNNEQVESLRFVISHSLS